MVHIFSLAVMTYLKRFFKNCYLKIFSSLSSSTLHAVNVLLWKKITTVSRPTTLRVFLMGRSGYPTKRGNWGGGGSPCKSKSLNFPLLLDKNITYWEIPHIGTKKVFLIAFRQVLTNIFPVAFIQLHNYDLFEKARLKLSPLIQNSVQQNYLPESYAKYLPS